LDEDVEALADFMQSHDSEYGAEYDVDYDDEESDNEREKETERVRERVRETQVKMQQTFKASAITHSVSTSQSKTEGKTEGKTETGKPLPHAVSAATKMSNPPPRHVLLAMSHAPSDYDIVIREDELITDLDEMF
jgi:ATPase subunit of ABC transporter with duplicated ATPase domains